MSTGIVISMFESRWRTLEYTCADLQAYLAPPRRCTCSRRRRRSRSWRRWRTRRSPPPWPQSLFTSPASPSSNWWNEWEICPLATFISERHSRALHLLKEEKELASVKNLTIVSSWMPMSIIQMALLHTSYLSFFVHQLFWGLWKLYTKKVRTCATKTASRQNSVN